MDRESFERYLECGEFDDLDEVECGYEEYTDTEGDGVNETSALPTHDNNDTTTLRLSTITAQELQHTSFRDLRFVVSGLLPAGLNILASPPKYGKSWMVLSLCLAVATGKSFLGYATKQCGCLYLALEDSPMRLKNRLDRLLRGADAPSGIHLCTSAGNLSDSLMDELEIFLCENPNVGLIVIDTLQRVRGNAHAKEGAYAADYREMSLLKSFADKHNISILLVHHLRKMRDDGDPFNMISGTNGIMGAADTTIVLNKEKRSDQVTTMSITGRDVEGDEIAIQFNPRLCMWENLGNQESYAEQQAYQDYRNDAIVHTIKELLRQPPHKWTGSASQILNVANTVTTAPLPSTPRKLSERLKDLVTLLYDNDGIVCERAKNGNGGGKYTFYMSESVQQPQEAQEGYALPFPD